MDFEPVKQRLAAALVEHGAPSLAVAVVRDGEILWEDGLGWADRAARRPADAHTPYSLASITKPITATALMLLVERGEVDLDEPIETYLRGCRLNARAGEASGATVRRVANHTAGLPLHYQFFYEDEPYRRPAMAETMRRYATLVTAPGERMQYSNLGYGILDHLISVVSGQPFADFLRREIFLPLGMTRSSLDVAQGIAPYAATRYGADGVAYPFYDFDHPGGSAVFASAHDLARFAMLHLDTLFADQQRLLKANSLDEMHEPSELTSPTGGYGIGWAINNDEAGYVTTGHSGGMGGVSTIMTLVPSERIVVVALCNASTALPFVARVEILSALLTKYAERRSEVESLLQSQPPTAAPKLSQETADLLAGSWEGEIITHEADLPLKLDVSGDGEVRVRLGAQLRTVLDEVRWTDGRLTGSFHGDIGTADARRRPHHISLDLGQRDDGLDGAATAMTDLPDGEGGTPGHRVGNALSHWVRLDRK